MDWAELTYDPSVTPAQRERIQEILGSVYPVQWRSFKVVDDGVIEWSYTDDRAVARMDGGKSAEMVLKRVSGNTPEPVVVQKLKYWGAPRNDGVILMPNEVQAYPKGREAVRDERHGWLRHHLRDVFPRYHRLADPALVGFPQYQPGPYNTGTMQSSVSIPRARKQRSNSLSLARRESNFNGETDDVRQIWNGDRVCLRGRPHSRTLVGLPDNGGRTAKHSYQ
jgi:hypothetical protein